MANKMEEFTAWVIHVMDGWPGDKGVKKQVIELLYDAYRQGKVDGMESFVNPMRQCVQNYDVMVAQSGNWRIKLLKTIQRVEEMANSCGVCGNSGEVLAGPQRGMNCPHGCSRTTKEVIDAHGTVKP